MDEVKINKRGQITIPKALRDRFGLESGISLSIAEDDGKIIIRPAIVCHHCGKTLPDAFRKSHTCPSCPPPVIIKVY